MRDLSYLVALAGILFLLVAAVAWWRIFLNPAEDPLTEKDTKRAGSAAMFIRNRIPSKRRGSRPCAFPLGLTGRCGRRSRAFPSVDETDRPNGQVPPSASKRHGKPSDYGFRPSHRNNRNRAPRNALALKRLLRIAVMVMDRWALHVGGALGVVTLISGLSGLLLTL
jgi:hypothetical protein